MQDCLAPSSPQVSVVIPTYNRAGTLGRAITSVLSQTFPDLECIVVDDGSTDQTVALVEGFQDPRLRLLRLPVNKGVSHARNVGIQAARGEWIAFLDSDDEWLPQMLERLTVRLRECGDLLATVVYCRCTVQDALTARMWCQPRVVYGGDVFRYLLSGWHPPTPSVFLVKRTSMLEVVGFDEELPCAEDYDLWLRLAEAHNHFAAVGERLVIKYDYGDQQMTTNPEIGTRAGEILDRRWGPVIQRHLGWVGYRRWKRKRWRTAQLAHFRRIKMAVAHGRRMEAWRNWVGMCRVFPYSYSMRYVCGALLMIVLGFRGYYLLVHAVEVVRDSIRDRLGVADSLAGL
ncbi:MAG: glycosyltransferase [bacterium]|uniref:Glycosyltransferase n=2 Tax=Candidatus Methylomirabilis TaxID=1170227 RepID=A0AAJ1EKA9_9BACT|nr:glycosyltransferase [Candidatus Methylomirabilis sp.]